MAHWMAQLDQVAEGQQHALRLPPPWKGDPDPERHDRGGRTAPLPGSDRRVGAAFRHHGVPHHENHPGPLQYYWPRNSVFAFQKPWPTRPWTRSILGETVCSRRHELRLSDWLGLARHLQGKGKRVVMSSQVLLESGSDVAWLHKLAANGEFTVEANDMGAVRTCLAGKQPFVAGPHLNLYNPSPCNGWPRLGASRW